MAYFVVRGSGVPPSFPDLASANAYYDSLGKEKTKLMTDGSDLVRIFGYDLKWRYAKICYAWKHKVLKGRQPKRYSVKG